jgi:DtxR family Mn-dependent transcriptional regulator
MMLTPVLEDYLKIILELDENKGIARVTDIAERLGVSKPTVSQTVKKLVTFGLAQKEKGGPILLTDSGKEQAIKIQNRNHIIKGFLTTVLGVDSKTSEKDACMMEHFLSSQTLEKIGVMISQT